MSKHRKRLAVDSLIVVVSVVIGVYLAKSGAVESVVSSLGSFRWLGAFVSGLFFTSVFTTAPSMGIISHFAGAMPIITLALCGGVGAMAGDYVIFRFMKDRVADDVRYLLSHSRLKRLSVLFHTRLSRLFIPFIGGLIIASPLPDELGLAILGISKTSNRVFLVTSFTMNTLGIALIGLASRMI